MDPTSRTGKPVIPYLVVITGPTGIGKTELCISLAEKYSSQIISADSRQMYRELKAGTAAPSEEQLARVKHWFIANLSIHDYYNASMFEVEVTGLLEKLFKTCKIIFMTGGSGLYIDAVCRGIDDLPSVDMELREELASGYLKHGIEWLRSKLKKVDPGHYGVVDLKNPNRMLKAIEISIMTGRPYSSLLTGKTKSRAFSILKIGLRRDRKELYRMINKRVDNMMKHGLLKEAEQLYRYRHLNALKTVGYRELFDSMDGKTTLETAVELIKRNTRRYARRQLTWLGRYDDIYWFHPDDHEGISTLITNKTGIWPEQA